jgi:hypothetical protein
LPHEPYQPIQQLLRAGRNDEAVALLQPVLEINPGDLAARELMFDAQFQRRSWAEALAEVEVLRKAKPDVLRYRRFQVATLSNMKRYDEAASEALQHLRKYGEDVEILNTLKIAYFYQGKTRQAVRCGQRVLELRDAIAWRGSDGSQIAPPAGRAGKNLISFSLWGRNAAYNHGALINLALAKTIYLGWVCRLYVGADVPVATVERLAAGGAEVVPFTGIPGLFARFLALSDPDAACVIVRDCDARLSEIEAELVAAWLESGLPFHVMRDHILHTELMIGCLWGGRADCGIDIMALMRDYLFDKYGYDQAMLGARLWPLIRNHCLMHDRFYRLAGVRSQPIPKPDSHLGAGYQDLAGIRTELERLGIAPIAGLDEGPVWQSAPPNA